MFGCRLAVFERRGRSGSPAGYAGCVSLELRLAAPSDLDAGTLYRILQLRVDVFVVEQQCPYLELDGRDLEPGARWLWATEGGAVIATLRILREDRATARIGRVATAAAGQGERSRQPS